MNELQLIFMKRGEPDRRYRLMVTLVRTDRPRYWNFLCFHCGSKICELANRRVVDVTDFYDPQDINNSGNMKHCKGTLPGGLPCPYTYFFNMT